MNSGFRGACLGLFLAISAHAQSTFGTITGTVVDPSGSAVQGAQVIVREQRSRVEFRVNSGVDGTFVAPNLTAGTYGVEAGASGFAGSEPVLVELLARQIARVEIKLAVAATATSLTVEAAPLAITTDSPTISDSRSGRAINELALNFRASASTSPISVATLSPGVQQDRGGNISVAGAMPYMTQYSVDGVSTQLVRSGGPVRDMFPSVEAIGEFQVNSSNNNAEFAQATDITTTSRSGGNDYTGNAYWFHQNRALNATNPFAPANPARPGTRLKPALVANTFGGTLGGPVLIPRLYNGRNKTFFFFNAEGVRRASQTTLNQTVPSDAFRSGDLSSITTPILNPFTRAPFPNNQIPVNPASARVLNLLYVRQNQPTGARVTPNFVANIATPYVQNGFDLRGDHYLTSKQRVFARFSYKDLNSQGTDGSAGYNTLAGTYSNPVKIRNLAGSHNWTVSPSVINEFRAGFSFANSAFTYPLAAQGGDIVRQIGITGLPPTPASGGLPNFSFTDGTFISTSPGRPRQIDNKTYQFSNNLTWVKGKHTFKFGYDWQRLAFRDILTFFAGDEFGEYFHTGQITGNAFAEFLLGIPSATTYARNGPDPNPFSFNHAWYAQDEWRVNSKLTLTYGVRYELHPPFDDKTKQLANFDRFTRGGRVIVQGEQGLQQVAPTFRRSIGSTPILTNDQAGLPVGLRDLYPYNINPRVGFAFRPFSNNKTVIRGGIGIYTVTVLGSVLYSLAGVATSDAPVFQQGPTPTGFALQFPNVFPTTAAGPAGIPDYRRANQVDLKDPRNYQWNFTIERELGFQTGLRLTYNGSRTLDLVHSPDLNQIPANTQGYAALANTRPFPNFNAVLTRDNGPSAKFHALTVEVSRRFSRGLSFQNSYAWSKNLSNALGPAPTNFSAENGPTTLDRFGIRSDYGNVPFTRRHRWVTSALWEIPVGKGRRFLANNPVADLAVGGWQLSGILTLQTGPFLTPTFTGTDPSGTGVLVRGVTTTQRPDRIGDGNLDNPTPTRYFDLGAFVRPANNIGRFGNAGVGILRGPGTQVFSLSAAKQFTLAERLKLRYEATFANLFNRQNYDVPTTLNIQSANFGRIVSTLPVDLGGPRTIQMSLRLLF